MHSMQTSIADVDGGGAGVLMAAVAIELITAH